MSRTICLLLVVFVLACLSPYLYTRTQAIAENHETKGPCFACSDQRPPPAYPCSVPRDIICSTENM